MNGFNVSGWVSKSLRKVTVPTEAMLDWRSHQQSRRRAFWSGVNRHSACKRERKPNNDIGWIFGSPRKASIGVRDTDLISKMP